MARRCYTSAGYFGSGTSTGRRKTSLVDRHRVMQASIFPTPGLLFIALCLFIREAAGEGNMYIRAELLQFNHRSAPARLQSAIVVKAQALSISAVRRIHRGCRAGWSKQRTISVRLTNTSGAISQRANDLVTGVNKNNPQHVVTVSRKPPTWDFPAILNTNIHGSMAGKLDELPTVCSLNNIQVASLTETWCTGQILEVLSLPGYTLFRRDRNNGMLHGGVACYVRDTIPTKHSPELDKDNTLEVMFLTMRHHRMPRDTIPLSHWEWFTIRLGLMTKQ